MPRKRLCAIFAFLMSCGMYAENRKISIATLEYPPFIYTENDQVKGPIADKVRDIFARLGVETTIRAYPIARGLLMVQNGEVDAYFSLKRNAEREAYLIFTDEPLIRQPFVFFARNDSGIRWSGDFAEIRNYRIGVVANTSYGVIFDGLAQKGFLHVIDETQTFEQNIKKLIAGRVDLIISSLDVGLDILRANDATGLVSPLSPPVEIIDSYLAFTKTKDFTSLAKEYDSILAGDRRQSQQNITK